MKHTTLAKLHPAAREDALRLLYLDEAGFCGSPPVQGSWSPWGLPHEIEPCHHCRRALDFGANVLVHVAHAGSIKGPHIERFVDDLPAYSPWLNMIEIVWRQLKYRWRRFVTWTKETIDAESAELLRGYGSVVHTSFS